MPNPTLPKVLIVDDKPENLYTLRKSLASLAVEVMEAESGFKAMELALTNNFCLAIVDVQMPEMDGYELVEFLRSNLETRSLPVIFVSAIFSDEYHHRKGYEAGAVDFMSKPFNPDILLSKVRVFLELYQQRLALQEANEQLTAINASRNKLFSIVAHDLRTPFTPLLAMCHYLAEAPEAISCADIRARGKAAYQAAMAVYDLLENLLQWSRLQRGRIKYTPTSVNLRDRVQSALHPLYNVAAGKNVTLTAALPPALSLWADQNMLDTILRNLVSNALKFTPSGGQVTVTAQPADTPGWVEIAVQDNGVGISPTDQAKLFKLEVHHSTLGTAAETGTGLGLLLCQEMVVQHAGRIWVESEVAVGTAVKFTLPLAAPETEWSGVDSATTPAPPDNGLTLTAPPPEDLQAVYALIKLGNMRQVNEWGDALIARDARYGPFVKHMQQLAHDFQKKQLLTLVEQYLTRP